LVIRGVAGNRAILEALVLSRLATLAGRVFQSGHLPGVGVVSARLTLVRGDTASAVAQPARAANRGARDSLSWEYFEPLAPIA
jgi:hypothetical protein